MLTTKPATHNANRTLAVPEQYVLFRTTTHRCVAQYNPPKICPCMYCLPLPEQKVFDGLEDSTQDAGCKLWRQTTQWQ